jgi:hypothetical protein
MISCFEYCSTKAANDLGAALEDELIMLASDIKDKQNEIDDLRKDRWAFATLGYNRNGNVVVKILDDTKFAKSVDQETRLTSEIARSKGLLINLNPIFYEAMNNIRSFRIPTVKGLQDHQQNIRNRIFSLESEVRQEAAFRISSQRAKGRTLEDVLADPSFEAYKKAAERDLNKLKEEDKLCDEFIRRAEDIMKNN